MAPVALSCSALKSGQLSLLRLDELGPLDRKIFVKHFSQLLSQDDSNGARVTGINRNRERTGVAIITVNGSVGFPDAISVAGGVVVVSDQENFRPKIGVECVLSFERSQVIAGGDDAAV